MVRPFQCMHKHTEASVRLSKLICSEVGKWKNAIDVENQSAERKYGNGSEKKAAY